MTKKDLKQFAIYADVHRINDVKLQQLLHADLTGDRYAVNEEWRKLIEAKSRFIPKIWGDID